jgi:hypothetical protein
VALKKKWNRATAPGRRLSRFFVGGSYTIIRPPASYIPLRNSETSRDTYPMGLTPAGFQMEVLEQRTDVSVQYIREAYGVPLAPSGEEAASIDRCRNKPEDMQYF